MDDYSGYDFDSAVEGYTGRLENQLRGAILPYLSAADLEQVIGVIVQIARRYGGTYWRRSRASLADGLNL